MNSFLRLNSIVLSALVLTACGSSSTAKNTPTTGDFSLDGQFIEESTVTITPNITDIDGLTNVTYFYTWYADDTIIEGNTSNAITFTEDQIGQVIRFKVTFEDDRGHEEFITSESHTVAMIENRSASAGFTFTGDFEEQQMVTVTPNITDADGIENIDLTYQWYADDELLNGITGTEISFTPADNGKSIHFVLSFEDDRGHAESIISETYTVANKEEFLVFTTDSGNSTYGMVIGSSVDTGNNWVWREELDRINMDPNVDNYTEIYYPDAATDHKGNIVVVMQSEYYPGFGGEYDVVYTHSTNNGASFSPINLINAYDTADSRYDDTPRIDTDGNGQWVTIWGTGEDTISETLTGLGNDSDIVYAVSTDNGATFSSPKVINDSALSDTMNVRDRMPDIAIHKNIWTAVWASEHDLSGGDGTDEDIVYSYSEDKGETWSDPAYINTWASTDNKTDYFPQMSMNSSGFAVTIWAGYNDGVSLDIYAATSTDFGKTWNTPKLINQYITPSNTDSQDYPNHVEVTEGNIAVISWEGGNPNHGSDEDVYFSVSTDMGENWSTEVAMNPDADSDSEDHRGLSIQQTQEGNWIAVYNDYSNDITYMRKSDDLLTWSDPVQVKTGAYEFSTLLLH